MNSEEASELLSEKLFHQPYRHTWNHIYGKVALILNTQKLSDMVNLQVMPRLGTSPRYVRVIDSLCERKLRQ
jgi:hypothetical protein